MSEASKLLWTYRGAKVGVRVAASSGSRREKKADAGTLPFMRRMWHYVVRYEGWVKKLRGAGADSDNSRASRGICSLR